IPPRAGPRRGRDARDVPLERSRAEVEEINGERVVQMFTSTNHVGRPMVQLRSYPLLVGTHHDVIDAITADVSPSHPDAEAPELFSSYERDDRNRRRRVTQVDRFA